MSFIYVFQVVYDHKMTFMWCIDALIDLIKDSNELSSEQSKAPIRHLENAQEELQSTEISESELKKYLKEAMGVMNVISKGADLSKKLTPILRSLGALGAGL